MKISFISLLIAVLLLTITATTYAETRYISDQLVVSVRSNKGKTYDVLASLLTATPVEILAEDDTFVKVRTAKGVEGFIRKQYVTKEIPKSIQIGKLKKQQALLEKQLKQQQLDFQQASELATSSQGVIERISNELEQVKQQLQTVSGEYELLQKQSEDVINVTNERNQLREENSLFLNELAVLQEENKGFHRTNMIQWFLAGGGVFLVGWLAGKVSRKKRGYSRF